MVLSLLPHNVTSCALLRSTYSQKLQLVLARLYRTIWLRDDVGDNEQAKKEAKEFNSEDIFATPKPERLIERILTLGSNPGDLVLDSFLGSGTTAAVAHKMGRRWIGIELGEHCYTHCIPRLQKVINGTDQGGVSQAVNWLGGGGFRFYELGQTLIKNDPWGNPVINPEFNAVMLAQALCKLDGFTYAPSETEYFIHGYSTEKSFIYVTTNYLSQAMVDAIAEALGPERSLLIYCNSFKADDTLLPNITLKKIPKAILDKCEWGHDDYSLEVANLPMAAPAPAPTKGKKKADDLTPDLFGD